jgi:hypothetical protein
VPPASGAAALRQFTLKRAQGEKPLLFFPLTSFLAKVHGNTLNECGIRRVYNVAECRGFLQLPTFLRPQSLEVGSTEGGAGSSSIFCPDAAATMRIIINASHRGVGITNIRSVIAPG